MARFETNVEFVTGMMEHSEHGALAQIFIIDAIAKWSKKIAETPVEELRTAFGPDSFINPDRWRAVAIEINRKMENR